MDANVTRAFQSDLSEYARRDVERRAFEARIRPLNKAALFDALAALGVAEVVVGFDGSGDSGQIESVEARRADGSVADLPENGSVPILRMRCDAVEPALSDLPLAEAIEALAYDFLESVHDGWENNEGAFGEFTFDVDARTIRLEYNERYETSDLSEHEF